jgi:hypothetical protein
MNDYTIFENSSFFLDSVYYKIAETLPDFRSIISTIEDVFSRVSLINSFVFVKAGVMTLPDGRKLFIKKYEKRDFFYRLEFIVRKARAEKFWHASLILEKNNIFHPRVYVALVKRKRGLFESAYIITEWVQNTFSPDTSSDLFKDASKSEYFCSDVVELLCKVHNAGIFHSDTKLYNFFMVSNSGGKEKLGIWDLDGAICYDELPERKRYKDMGRLTASFIEFYIKNGVNIDKNDFVDKILYLYKDGTGINLNHDILGKISNKHLARKGFI